MGVLLFTKDDTSESIPACCLLTSVQVRLSDGRCSISANSVLDAGVEEDAGPYGKALHLSPDVPALTCSPELLVLTERMRSGSGADNGGFLRRAQP